MNNPNYKLKAFTHWMNLAFLFMLFMAWLFGIHLLTVLAIAFFVQAGVLWIVPDTDGFKAYVKQSNREDGIEEARWYYLNQLWDVKKPSRGPLSLLLSSEINWSDHLPHDSYQNEHRKEYVRMLGIRSKLIQMSKDRPDVVSQASITEVEKNINNWLELRVAAQDARESLGDLDKNKLMRSFKTLLKKRKATKDPTMLRILSNKAKLIKNTLDQIPRLTLRAERSTAQGDLIQEHLETYLTQALTARNSGAAVHLGSLADLNADSSEEDAMIDLNSELGNFDISGDDPIWDMLAEDFELEEEGVVMPEVVEVSA